MAQVFISYTHDSPDHKDRVLRLADQLCVDGVDTEIDQYQTSPPEGWPRWMDKQIRDSRFVLVVCTETYLRRANGEEQPGRGLGAVWESSLTYQQLYKAAGQNTRFIPVLFDGADPSHIPNPLDASTHYRLSEPFNPHESTGYQQLLRHLTNQPATPKPPLGKTPNLPARPGPPATSSAAAAPAPAMAAAHTRIPHELPPAAEAFFGREPELAQLTERLRAAKNTAVAGPAGFGKTALAAKALQDVVGATPATLAASPFPDGVVFLDLYTLRGMADAVWNTLANKIEGAEYLENRPARDRVADACRARRLLVVLEGAEEADGQDGRADLAALLAVLAPQNRWLVLTRTKAQARAAEIVELRETLGHADAGQLLDAAGKARIPTALRNRVLGLLQGHPLALTWAGGLLGRDDDDPAVLVADWEADRSLSLSDPARAPHTLEWLFQRSARGLSPEAQQVLAAAGLLAHAPVPLAAMEAALGGDSRRAAAREPLRTLVQRSLLRRAEADEHWQFPHVLAYQFARKETESDPALRERLGRWLHGHLMAIVARGEPGSEIGPLEHLEALLRADHDQRLWLPLVYDALYKVQDRLTDLGRLNSVKRTLEAVAAWIDRFPADKAKGSEWIREKSVLLNRQGDVLLAQGDLAGAQLAYGQSLEMTRRLAKTDPTNAGWQRDLSVSHNKMGDVLRDQGDLAGAQSAYGQALEVTRRLAESDPTNAVWQRQLSVSHNKMGDVLRDQGDLAGAQSAYGQSLEVRRRLVESDPTNAGWQRDLSVSLTKIAELKEQQGDRAAALPLAEQSLAIDERLAALDPTNATWRKDVAFTRALVARLRRRP